MKNQDSEEQADVKRSVISISNTEFLKLENSEYEGDLHYVHEDGSVEDINLVVGFELILFFVLSHEGTVRNGVHVL